MVLLGTGLSLLALAALAAAFYSWAPIPILALIGLLSATLGVLESAGLSRVQRAFILAPLAPCCIVAAFGDAWPLGIVIAPFAYVFAFVLGGSCFLVMRRLGWLHAWQVVGMSAVLGGASGALLLAPHTQASELLAFSGYGAATGLAFWLVAFSPWPPSLVLRR